MVKRERHSSQVSPSNPALGQHALRDGTEKFTENVLTVTVPVNTRPIQSTTFRLMVIKEAIGADKAIDT
jgi:hypothetical protein